jgi:branched-chain amino acid transport system permease protein
MSQTFTVSGGVIFTMKALVIVIMGGVGNLAGTLIAGLILGVVEVGVMRLIDPGLTLAANFLIFLAVLIFRPTGIFGRSA